MNLDDLISWHQTQLADSKKHQKIYDENSRDRRSSNHTRDQYEKLRNTAIDAMYFHGQAVDCLTKLRGL